MKSSTTQRDAELLADLVQLSQSIARHVYTVPAENPDILYLTRLEGVTMQLIDRHPGMRATELADRLGLRHSNASTALRELERKGMVRREPDPTDRRASLIWPTALANANLARLRAHWARMLAPLGLAPEDLTGAVAVLQRVEAAVADRQPPSGG